MEAKQTGRGRLQLRYQRVYDLIHDCKHKQKPLSYPFIMISAFV